MVIVLPMQVQLVLKSVVQNFIVPGQVGVLDVRCMLMMDRQTEKEAAEKLRMHRRVGSAGRPQTERTDGYWL